jgi:hypothetical protein
MTIEQNWCPPLSLSVPKPPGFVQGEIFLIPDRALQDRVTLHQATWFGTHAIRLVDSNRRGDEEDMVTIVCLYVCVCVHTLWMRERKVWLGVPHPTRCRDNEIKTRDRLTPSQVIPQLQYQACGHTIDSCHHVLLSGFWRYSKSWE